MSDHRYDICIIGAGVAGLLLALEARKYYRDVCIIESGSKTPEDYYQALNDTDTSALQYDSVESRARAVGGSMHLWAGRCGTLDPIDFEERSWISMSGWPINSSDLKPFYEKALTRFKCPFPSNPIFNPSKPESSALQSAAIEEKNYFLLDYVNGNFVKKDLLTELNQADNVTLLQQTTLVSLETSDGNKIDSCKIASDDRKSTNSVPGVIHADRFVIACGGIESARLLLASRSHSPEGIGNAHDLVGRFFTDHPRSKSAPFEISNKATVEKFKATARHQIAYRFSDDAQRLNQQPNHSFMISQSNGDIEALSSSMMDSTDGLSEKRQSAARKNLRRLWRMTPIWFRRTLRDLLSMRKTNKFVVTFKVELEPNAQSRIELSEDLDRHGTPKARINWTVTDRDRQQLTQYYEQVNRILVEADIIPDHVSMPDAYKNTTFKDSSHPIGATRMAASPEKGVVDANLKVFGVDNLYVCSSSVFPTPGSANPTLTIAALSLRLADHLRSIHTDIGTDGPEDLA